MKTLTNVSAFETASASRNMAWPPIQARFAPNGASPVLRLVEEAALEHSRAILRRQLHVARREEEDLVGDALHASVERVRQAAREVDQPLAELRDGGLEVED